MDIWDINMVFEIQAHCANSSHFVRIDTFRHHVWTVGPYARYSYLTQPSLMKLYVFNESHQNSNHKNPELMLILGSQFLFPAEKFISKRTSSKNQLLWYQLAQESARVEFFFNVFSEFLPFMNLPEKVTYILKFSLGKHFPFLILWVFFF